MKAVLISLAPERGKRKHFGKLPFQRIFNYGLLSVASIAVSNGFEVEVWDAADPNLLDGYLVSALRSKAPDVVGLSCLSGFSYPSLVVTSAEVRQALPDAIIVTGGMDHVGRMPNTVLHEIPVIDAVVSGYGEIPFTAILQRQISGGVYPRIPGVTFRGQTGNDPAATPPIPGLQYKRYIGFAAVPPSVELARGCPFECSFCISAGGSLVRRTPSELAEELLQACIAYGDPESKIYLEAPLATFSRQYLKILRAEIAARGIAPTWRAECRADNLPPELADDLAEAGCRALDIGLESASPVVLSWMCKTSDPNKYLERGSRLLAALRQSDIFSKVNIMFYAGENTETMKTTYDFLCKHKAAIGAIAAGPLYLYPGIVGRPRILALLEKHGGEIVNSVEWRERHLTPVNPSRDLSFDYLRETSLLWEKEFQSAYKYWYHRRWGYFSPNVTYSEFVSAVLQAGPENFPFPAETLYAGTAQSYFPFNDGDPEQGNTQSRSDALEI